MKQLILGALMLLASSAFADLTGHQMKCSYYDFGFEEQIDTNYIFSQGPNGEKVAEVFSTSQGQDLVSYTLSGSRLVIQDGGDSRTYDISNPAKISRVFKLCVTGGVPDGDTRPICVNTMESCQLN